MSEPQSLTTRQPHVTPEDLLAGLVPPPQFSAATFDSYRPDPAHPSQAEAMGRMSALAREVLSPRRRGLLRRPVAPQSLYLDGGYGVGKTHLLASLAHEIGPERSAYGTFVEYTHLVGALGFAECVQVLSQRSLVAIDEFELDDPGDTVLMSRLLRELADAGVTLVATSNTLPEALGEGRFAAEDFLREIQALASRFEILRIDGPDYRHRSGLPEHEGATTAQLAQAVAASLEAGARVSTDDWEGLLAHLATIHPSRYGSLIDDLDAVVITGTHQIDEDMVGLRLVVLVDRLYDRDLPVRLGPVGVADLFSDRMLEKGYRKKYLRALSRFGALTHRSLPGHDAEVASGEGASE